jgi:hypothetical protein
MPSDLHAGDAAAPYGRGNFIRRDAQTAVLIRAGTPESATITVLPEKTLSVLNGPKRPRTDCSTIDNCRTSE